MNPLDCTCIRPCVRDMGREIIHMDSTHSFVKLSRLIRPQEIRVVVQRNSWCYQLKKKHTIKEEKRDIILS